MRDQARQRNLRMLAVCLAGVYSWTLTVLPSLLSSDGSALGNVCGWSAVMVLLVSPFLPTRRMSMVAALDVFVGLCILSWWLGDHDGAQPSSGVFGSLGWLAYVLALGSLSTPSDSEQQESAGPELSPRSVPRRLPILALLLTLVAAIALLGAAWQVRRPAVAVLAHVTALFAALLLLRGGAHLSGYWQTLGTRLHRPMRLRRVVFPLALLAGLVALGVFLRFFAAI